KVIDFGLDLNYGQTIGLTTRPVVPPVLKLDKFLTPSFRYSSRYDWQNNLQAGALGRSAGVSASLNAGLDVNIKAIGSEIWGATPSGPQRPGTPQTGKVADDTTETEQRLSLFDRLDRITRVLIKAPLFEFDRLNFSFTQTNTARNSGVIGRPGWLNLYGRVPFFQESLEEYGPSALYQLGLSSDPHGRVVVGTKSSFPFVRGYTVPGIRAPSGNLTDLYTQVNRITMRTSRPLWEGARLEVNWNVGWSYNSNRSISTTEEGVPIERNRTISGDVDRSFFSFPPVLVFKLFKTSIEEVNKRFERLKLDPHDVRSNDVKLSQAFEEGLEGLPIGRKLFGNLIPRPNWSFRWDGLEKLSLFSSFAQRVSLDHTYSSTYR
ncbi:MAG: hypothetical protein WD295_01940, partial [Bacteroidota bacterium]